MKNAIINERVSKMKKIRKNALIGTAKHQYGLEATTVLIRFGNYVKKRLNIFSPKSSSTLLAVFFLQFSI